MPGLHAVKLPPITESFSEWNLGNEVPVYPIHKVYAPIGWSSDPIVGSTMIHDLAIVILKTPIIFTPKITTIKLDFRPEYDILRGLYIQNLVFLLIIKGSLLPGFSLPRGLFAFKLKIG